MELSARSGGARSMKYKEERPLANLDAAVKKLLEIANGMEGGPRRQMADRCNQRTIPQRGRQRSRLYGGS